MNDTTSIMMFVDYNLIVSNDICNLEALKSILIHFSTVNKNVFEIQRELGGGQIDFLTNLYIRLKEYGKHDHQSKL